MRRIMAATVLVGILVGAPSAFAQSHLATFREIASNPSAAAAFKAMAKGHVLPDWINGKTVESPGHEIMFRGTESLCHERLQAA